MQISNELRTMILRRKPGHTLEAPFYQSREVFDLDVEAIFGRHWIYAGVEPDIPEPGDYFTVPIGRASVFVVRDDDMSIRAFHNVCRHRGARLCDGNKGSVGNIVCPYHQWTYDLTGKLIFTEHMGDGFDRSQYSLKKVHVASVAGLLFVCLANEPPADIEDMRREMEPYIAPHRVVDCKVAFEEDLIENGNWKLTMENNRECYHCKANHPELTVSLYEFGFGYQPSPENASEVQAFKDLIKTEHARWESCGLPSVEREFLDSRVTAYRIERLPLDEAGESQTMNSKVACQKLLGNLQQRNLGGLSFWTQPNSWHHFMSDHIVTFSVLWDTLWEAGAPFEAVACGGGAYDSLRIEKGYRLWGADIDEEHDPYEAGLGFAVKLKKDRFLGRDAAARAKEEGARRKLCCLVMEDPRVVLVGKEPILDGERTLGYVTSAGWGATVEESIAYGYLPVEHSKVGTRVSIHSEGRREEATVADEPLFDPTMARLRDIAPAAAR